ncbi:ABC transporter ATP-binding protein [Stagnihabitans tardus]|uniref:ATP-binding cassette domain-containing protein n=1 Tax=Stagnihabitans tardus TaxID=2699202 RepID=A0AAE5BU81_9RHOB|nr:ABC transporter ATP-binding protein [Stagnihabitans tardus]NBZ86479.1 ATP-binding cassette domain-containing protein [Stagnihabitans tardus]
MTPETLLEVRNLTKHFPLKSPGWGKPAPLLRAVEDVSFSINKGDTFGLVGESGSGKSTVARLILRAYELTSGTVNFRRADGSVTDISRLDDRALRPIRAEMQMIFQDPYSSLNPRMTLRDLIGEPMLVHGHRKAEIDDRVAELLGLVGLRPEFAGRYPHAFSGGQRQRIGIARALALNPSFIAADEAVSALDVSVAAQNINLLQDLQERFGITYLFITHDLGMVEHISNKLAVMYLGRIVEMGDTATLLSRPRHPYTEALLRAVPQPDPRGRAARRRPPLAGEVPSAVTPPSGCAFHPRCPYATPDCARVLPELRLLGGVQVRCHRAEDLALEGVHG